MQTIRLYDENRDPPGWRQLIKLGQYAVFAQHLDSGAPCDANGTPFTSSDLGTCVIFDSLSEAAAFCQSQVERVTTVRFDIFDSAGLVAPPLLTVVHPSRAAKLGGARRATRVTNWGAGLLLIAGPVLIWFDWAYFDGLRVLPTIVGINCLIFAARLLLLNRTYSSAEQSRRERFAQHLARERTKLPLV